MRLFSRRASCAHSRLPMVRPVVAAFVLVVLAGQPGGAWAAAGQPANTPSYVNTCAGVTAHLVNGPQADTYHLVKTGAGPFEVIAGSQVTLAPFQTAPPFKAAGPVDGYLMLAWQPTSKTDLDLELLFYWVRPGYCQFTTTYVQTCSGITTTITNTGPARAEYGLLWTRQGIDGVSGVPGGRAALEPGQSRKVVVSRAGGLGFSVNWQPVAELDIWDGFTAWTKPAGCDSTPPVPEPRLEAEFVDGCFGVDTNVTNIGVTADTVSLLRRQSGIDPTDSVPGQRNIVLEPGQTHEARVHAVNGRGFSLRWQSDSVPDIGQDFHTWVRPAGCASLPVTGPRTAHLVTTGALLTILGLVLAYAARRRQAAG